MKKLKQLIEKRLVDVEVVICQEGTNSVMDNGPCCDIWDTGFGYKLSELLPDPVYDDDEDRLADICDSVAYYSLPPKIQGTKAKLYCQLIDDYWVSCGVLDTNQKENK